MPASGSCCNKKMVTTGPSSRFISDAESRYAIIELELLAVSWAMTKCKLFILLHCDYQTPRTSHTNTHQLDKIENSRLQCLKGRIMAYNFTAQWIKGVLNNAPDALSRNPVSDPQPHELMAECDPQNNLEYSITEIHAVSASNISSFRLRQHIEADQGYQEMKH